MMHSRSWSWTLVVCLLLFPDIQGSISAPQKQIDPPEDVSALLPPTLLQHNVPGMTAAIVTGNRVVALGAAGLRERGSSEKVTVNDRFHLGSCTKAMTATLCAFLVQKRNLKWQTTIAEIFSDVKPMHPAYKTVTLEQLLTNHGGFPHDIDPRLWMELRLLKKPPEIARRKLLTSIMSSEPAVPPGKKYTYSNAGFSVAGHMAETKLGKPYEFLMEKILFKPLGMTSAGFGAPGTVGKISEPRGHRKNGLPVQPGPLADNPEAIAPAGRVHASIGDWGKFIQFHLRGAQGKVRRLPKSSFDKLHRPYPDSETEYAMGWIVTSRPWGGGRVLTHAGSNTMWYAVVWLSPKKNFAVLVACNQGGDNAAKACDDIAGKLIRHYQKRR